jgi:outer membrane protein assembly factor BamD (BamD/ComL family)
VLFALVCLAGCKSSGDGFFNVRNIYGRHGKIANGYATRDPFAPLEGQADFDKAQALFDAEKYDESEKAFKTVAKKYKDKPIEEEAMFMIAESKYMRKEYPSAQDAYGELMKKYTATRHTEASTRRLYSIARYWLGSPPSPSQIELVQYNEGRLNTPEGDKDIPVPRQVAIAPNFTDSTRPFFDTHGRAMQALTAVWLNDPTGPIADDALLMAATYHMRKKDFKEADHYFNILREEYPQSEHVQTAYVVGQRVKLLAYQGADYDGKALEDARKLTGSTLKLFPDVEQTKQLESDLAKMNAAAVARDWKRVELYLRKRHYESAATYCVLIMNRAPDSEYAVKAHQTMVKMGPDKAGEAWNRMPRPSQSVPSRGPRDTFDETPSSQDGIDVDREPIDRSDEGEMTPEPSADDPVEVPEEAPERPSPGRIAPDFTRSRRPAPPEVEKASATEPGRARLREEDADTSNATMDESAGEASIGDEQ